MVKQRKSAWQSGSAAVLLCAGAALLVAAPSAVLALGTVDGNNVSASVGNGFSRFTPASIDPRLAALMAKQSDQGGKQMRFTPAVAANRVGRTMTVAVRIDEDTARAITVRQALAAADDAQSSITATRPAPMRYNLGVSRGYQGFAVRAPELPKTLGDASIPDLETFKPSAGVKDKPSRFNARVALEEVEKTGRDTRTRDGLGDQTVDVGGSYSLTRNFNLTAGVRYSQDRDRLEPIANGKQDSQAVYVGTQFHF